MEYFDFLEDFEKRMQILAAIDSIVNRYNRNMDLEKLFERNWTTSSSQCWAFPAFISPCHIVR